jgi:hypothetical protein
MRPEPTTDGCIEKGGIAPLKHLDTAKCVKKRLAAQAANGSANMFSRIRMEGYQTLEGRSKSLARGKTSKPPARRSRARGFVAPWSVSQSIEHARALEASRLAWLEEPVWPPEDHAGLARVRAATTLRTDSGDRRGFLLQNLSGLTIF